MSQATWAAIVLALSFSVLAAFLIVNSQPHQRRITMENLKIENNFFCPAVWDEESKAAYSHWLAGQPDSHPAKNDPTPWIGSDDQTTATKL